ncbi:hypothetical protein [Methylobacterium sp. WSM2598]|uniref:hypothetical protein n=1 Tax=Methylobacterium sp. WSM2598 TaxID=398261 RepID=UPI0003746B13|nr:hypothetical protein [Methylobacterium sp. WSM2598]
MSAQRHLSWSAAMQDIERGRGQYRPGERAALVRAATFAKLAADRARQEAAKAPLVVAGRYDRRAIMAAAVTAARSRRACTGEAWNVCLSAALKGVWQVAKAARLAKAH